MHERSERTVAVEIHVILRTGCAWMTGKKNQVRGGDETHWSAVSVSRKYLENFGIVVAEVDTLRQWPGAAKSWTERVA